MIHRDVSFKIQLLAKALLERATHLGNALPVVGRQLARFVNPPSHFYSQSAGCEEQRLSEILG